MYLGEGRGYSAEWMQWTKQAAAEIHVVQDEIADSIVARARASVGRAEILCFMGFAYAIENLSRLGIRTGEQVSPNARLIYGTGVGLQPGPAQWVCRHVKDFQLLTNTDCMGLLLQAYVFED